MMRWQLHQLDHMQIICTLLETDNHASTSSLNFLQAGCSSDAQQQCQSTEGTVYYTLCLKKTSDIWFAITLTYVNHFDIFWQKCYG